MPKRRYYYNGKRVSKGERKLAAVLDKHNIKFEMEKSFNGCRNGKGNKLRFDFYLEQHNILIEYQGHHHYHPVNKGRRAKHVHDTTIVHDRIKRQFCIDRGFGLLEIKHDEFANIEDIILNVIRYGRI
jgi:hypothetical protein